MDSCPPIAQWVRQARLRELFAEEAGRGRITLSVVRGQWSMVIGSSCRLIWSVQVIRLVTDPEWRRTTDDGPQTKKKVCNDV